jgi:hypothetical protein
VPQPALRLPRRAALEVAWQTRSPSSKIPATANGSQAVNSSSGYVVRYGDEALFGSRSRRR